MPPVTPVQLLTISDLLGRRIDILGAVQQVDMGFTGQGITRTVFTTGNIAFPAPTPQVYVAWVSVATVDGQVLPTGTIVKIGSSTSLSGTPDWSDVIDVGGAPWNTVAAVPVVIDPGIGYLQSQRPGVYGIGVAFSFLVVTGDPSANGRLATVTAYGWSA